MKTIFGFLPAASSGAAAEASRLRRVTVRTIPAIRPRGTGKWGTWGHAVAIYHTRPKMGQFTRRQVLASLAQSLLFRGLAASTMPSEVRVHILTDLVCPPREPRFRSFFEVILPEACRDLAKAGVRTVVSEGHCRLERRPNRAPVIGGLAHDRINVVLTRTVPMEWDRCRALRGLAFRYRGAEVCLIALDHAHPHRVPYFAVNTCLHELLHVLAGDTGRRKVGFAGDLAEFRIDILATRLWLRRDTGQRHDRVNV